MGSLFQAVILHPLLAPQERPSNGSGRIAFQAHVDLLQFFLTHRIEIADRIQDLLNAQRKPIEYLQDGPLLSRQIEDCFFTLPQSTPAQSRLRGQLEEAHWTDGFKPREIAGLHNGLIDPGEMMVRAFHLWRQTRWPGRNGRVRYAHTLFNLYVVRCLALLTMRAGDAGSSGAGDRLSQTQGVLDQLWKATPSDQPSLVRDARWLIQLAQSPATDDLRAYFEVAARIAETMPSAERIEIHKAGASMTGGHLRSQLRHYSTKKSVPVDDRSLIPDTRNSNALDYALLVQDLVPLLEAYEDAVRKNDPGKRSELASTICQGLSPDPELFLNRIDLLGAFSTIEHVFIETDREGRVAATTLGRRHGQQLEEYETLVARVSRPLLEDALRARPVVGAYSPYGVIYGFSSDIIEHMTLKTLTPDATCRFSLEDVFSDGDAGKLAWVSGWRKLPHLTRDVQMLFDYPQRFAEDVFLRLEQALRRRVADGESNAATRTGRVFIELDDHPGAESKSPQVPELPAQYVVSSDRELVAAHKAVLRDESNLSIDRREGKYLVSYRAPGGWVAITKDVLSDLLEKGHDVKISGLSPQAVEALKVMYPRLVTLS